MADSGVIGDSDEIRGNADAADASVVPRSLAAGVRDVGGDGQPEFDLYAVWILDGDEGRVAQFADG